MKILREKPFYSERVSDALRFASWAHKEQTRKTDPEIPYIYHPIAVAFVLQSAEFSEDVVVAGILHDVVEDCDVEIQDIEKRFGNAVAKMVSYVSEDKSKSWEERKEEYRAQVMSAPDEVKAISAVDKICNTHDMLNSLKAGRDIWKHFKKGKEQTFAHSLAFAKELKENWSHPLSQELLDITEELMQL